jgi:capsular polysaccharide biosynthesis protein
MPDTFDAIEFALYLRARWRVVAISCASALVLAGVASAAMPRRYTATATLIIEPSAGMDPRAAMAVSPVYLESLKTYESYATSDTLFSRALDELGLHKRYSDKSVEALKRQVLSVSKPNNTRIIDISATLSDPLEAKRLAQFVAEQTVALNRSLEQHSGDYTVQEAQDVVERAEARLRDAVRAGAAGSGAQSVEALTADLKNTTDLRYGVQSDLARSRTELAYLTSQPSTFKAGDEDRATGNAREIVAARARVQDLEEQNNKLETAVAEKAARLERAKPRRDSLDAEQRLATTDLENARTKLGELRAASAFRGERLEVLDPGIVPGKPSFPNGPLIQLVAFAVSLSGSMLYLAAAFGYSRALASRAERVYSLR